MLLKIAGYDRPVVYKLEGCDEEDTCDILEQGNDQICVLFDLER